MSTPTYQFDQLVSKSLESLVDHYSNLVDIGLLIGQQNDNHSKVSFLSMISTPKPFENQDVEYKTTKDIDDQWVAEHSRLVSKMLYGGIYILGICLSVPSINTVNDSNLSLILTSIRSLLIGERSYLTNITKTLYALIYIRSTKQYVLKSINTSSTDSKFKQISDIKFTQPSQDFVYLSLNTTLNINMKLNSANKKFSKELFGEMRELIEKNLYSQMKKSIIFTTADGQYCPFDSSSKLSEYGSPSKPVVLDALMAASDIVLGSLAKDAATATIHFGKGVQQYRSYSPKTESISTALEFLLHDIVNSFQSRIELLVEGDEESSNNDKLSSVPEMTLPRRASIQWIPGVELCDYLYEHEGYYEFQQRIQELTNLELSNTSSSSATGSGSNSSLPSWIKSIEKCSLNSSVSTPLPPPFPTKSTSTSTPNSSKTVKTSNASPTSSSSNNLQYLSIALIFLIVALLYQFFMK